MSEQEQINYESYLPNSVQRYSRGFGFFGPLEHCQKDGDIMLTKDVARFAYCTHQDFQRKDEIIARLENQAARLAGDLKNRQDTLDGYKALYLEEREISRALRDQISTLRTENQQLKDAKTGYASAFALALAAVLATIFILNSALPLV